MSNRLKKLRKENGLTQSDLAKVLNTSQSQYGKYENGKTNLSIEDAKILAEYFGVSTPYLLGLDDDSCIDGSKKMTPFQSLVRDRGISLKAISEATGIGYSTVGNYNQGSRIPNARNAQLLSEYFGVSISYLLGHEENYTPNKTNARISIELVKELYSIREKRSSLHQEYIELDKKEQDILERIKEIVR
ncbi:Cro/CI family transcriptional regulator [Streptococcus pneumoniae]|uniref:helix-turn-helix domain-containing protein n=1 Tax=Streptococcus pneumoniae TaxID=1313 RepID=UPI0010D8EAFF|nr:helix-turn-helix transcriptional regulator [Streptococcus pneumoniae]WAC86018.1 helix-turn-helix transcriptional regulator [Streptococcus pneumoniae]WAC86363.1 helix-turn-helix transcriptional regulator [Streptococcus pneumoniae]WAC88043.1 helix-turn-helix transcriptional regulator [Streptococcus pneumoniae]WAC88365.1 helix-turn-helix transcriptional regulator [Streptococcus pneumoniae]VJF03197.1 Cro/CI family transcriptional regulator [Streptococcus pneumoniae]